MKKILIAAVLATAFAGTAFATEQGCGSNCSLNASSSGSGSAFGHLNNSISTSAIVYGNGSSVSGAGSYGSVEAGVALKTFEHDAYRNGTAKSGFVAGIHSSVETGGYAVNHSTGYATGKAESSGYGKAGAEFKAMGSISGVGHFGAKGEVDSKAGYGVEAKRNEGAMAIAYSENSLLALGGISAKLENCEVVNAYGTMKDIKMSESGVAAESYGGAHAFAFAAGGAEFEGGFKVKIKQTPSRGGPSHGDYDKPKHHNNGWGNGDQDAPGNSEDNNNAENNHSGNPRPPRGH